MGATLSRVGWYTGGQQPGRGSEYIEIGRDHSVLRVPGVALAAHERMTGFALAEVGAFVSTDNSKTHETIIYSFDGSSWRSVTLSNTIGRIWWLYGGDGERIVATGRDSYTVRFLRPGQ
jgi:hypothetical protein